MSDLVETRHYDEASDSLIVKTSYDSSEVMANNIMTKNLQPETGRYKKNLVRVATIHLGDVVRLKNMGYNILSPDPDERKRALLYIQAEEKALMVMPGTPIGKKAQSWR
jgi:hypothetical protein